MLAAREEDGEKRQRQADDFEKGIERRDDKHAVEECRVRRQLQDCGGGERQANRGHERANRPM